MLQGIIRRVARSHQFHQKKHISRRNNHLFRSIQVPLSDAICSVYSLQYSDILTKERPVVVATSASTHVTNRTNNNSQIISLLSYLYEKLKKYLLTLYRFVRQSVVFTPVTICAPIAWWQYRNQQNPNWFWELLRNSIYTSGPCLIKFAQWIATRPDIFPMTLCQELSHMQNKVLTKVDYAHAEHALIQAFGNDWNKSLTLDKNSYLGSGCVAQVLKGKLNEKPVAIKILHAGVRDSILSDISLMAIITDLLELLPGISNLSLRESIDEFKGLMLMQLDLTNEAKNMVLFQNNFNKKNLNIKFANPIYPYVTTSVMVQSFEEGELMKHYMEEDKLPMKYKIKLAKLGLNAILKMVFQDNFIHCDMHPGNIICRFDKNDKNKVELILIDTGIVCTFSSTDRRNFLELFNAVLQNNGQEVGKLLIERSRTRQCRDYEKFLLKTESLVNNVHESGLSLGKISVGKILTDILSLCYLHEVKLESRFVAVVLALGIVEGIGRTLDPDIDILNEAGPYVFEACVAL